MRLAQIAVMLVLGVTPAWADETLTDARGRRVHLWAPGRVDARLVASDAQTVTVAGAGGETRTFDRSAITKMEVSRGRHWHVGMTVAGAGVGALTAFLVAYGTDCSSAPLDSQPRSSGCHRWTDGEVGGAVLGGAALGALVTGLATRNLGWEDVEVGHKAAITVIPVRRGVAVAASLRF